MMPDYIRAELEQRDSELQRHWTDFARKRLRAAVRTDAPAWPLDEAELGVPPVED